MQRGYYESAMAMVAKNDDVGARKELVPRRSSTELTRLRFGKRLLELMNARSRSALFTDLRRIVELDPHDLDARIKLARMMVSGVVDAALKVLDAANEGEKPDAALHSLRSIVLLRTNERQQTQSVRLSGHSTLI